MNRSSLQVTDIFAKWKKTQNCNLVQPEPIKMSKNHKIGAKSIFNNVLNMTWTFSSPLPLRELVLNFMATNSLYLGKLRRRRESRKDGQTSSQISCICSALWFYQLSFYFPSWSLRNTRTLKSFYQIFINRISLK